MLVPIIIIVVIIVILILIIIVILVIRSRKSAVANRKYRPEEDDRLSIIDNQEDEDTDVKSEMRQCQFENSRERKMYDASKEDAPEGCIDITIPLRHRISIADKIRHHTLVKPKRKYRLKSGNISEADNIFTLFEKNTNANALVIYGDDKYELYDVNNNSEYEVENNVNLYLKGITIPKWIEVTATAKGDVISEYDEGNAKMKCEQLDACNSINLNKDGVFELVNYSGTFDCDGIESKTMYDDKVMRDFLSQCKNVDDVRVKKLGDKYNSKNKDLHFEYL